MFDGQDYAKHSMKPHSTEFFSKVITSVKYLWLSHMNLFFVIVITFSDAVPHRQNCTGEQPCRSVCDFNKVAIYF